MIIRATGIPLAIYPYSSTSHIVHWLTRFHGKISTILKGALRLNSRFIGEYELFSTSEVLYFAKPSSTLYTAKECSLLEKRTTFRTNWRAMQSASYLAALFNKTTPEDAPHPELFALYEDLLDYAAKFGHQSAFLPWAELKFCDAHGHTPNLENCVLCSSKKDLRFCASQGGVVCSSCTKEKKLPTLGSAIDVLEILKNWQNADLPVQTIMTDQQSSSIHAILNIFMMSHFNIKADHRYATLTPDS